ncbi:MAG: Gfo/Idh/MocA family oxidoreductase [Salinivirgaceae bacterium]
MQQLTQKLGSGDMVIQELPVPQVGSGMLLVQNHYSLISAGTEGSTVQAARKSLLGKAKERPQQVKQVLDVLKKQGPVQTYRAVMKKLDAYSPLGYSSAGIVVAVGDGVSGFSTGDKVACAGAGYANHAELVSVPQNLCVKLNPDADLKKASYNTLGAIALQGVRQADLRLGESCAVIGLGLLGQLAALMLKASGVRVIGIDIDSHAVALAEKQAVDLALTRNTPGIEQKIEAFTGGHGVDAVIIAAATHSTDPVNFAGAIARKKGKVVVLGAVPTGFDRDPFWYRKELELKMACSYGPGRYDLNYEEKGLDYPYAYVRWTEKRNMEAFQELVFSNKIDIAYLTSHEFAFEDTPKAYDMVADKTEPFLGIVLKYDVSKELELRNTIAVATAKKSGKIKLAFVGAGSYAQGNLLPNLPKNNPVVVNKTVLTQSGTTSKRVAEKFGFESCTSDENEVFNHEVNTVFITTRHDSHAAYVLKALEHKQHVFVEKPLCLNAEELEQIDAAYKATQGETHLMVGFNRRFSPLSVQLKKKLGSGPMTMLYRVNAGAIPADSWIQDLEMGGGRIIGEACHFIDYLTWLNGSLPLGVYAAALPDPKGLNDTVNITLEFENGSTGVVAYYANGSKELPKEYIEVFSSGTSGILSDFKELKIYGKGKPYKKKLWNQDKGQAGMVKSFLEAIIDAKPTPISYREIYSVNKATFAVLESIKQKQRIAL